MISEYYAFGLEPLEKLVAIARLEQCFGRISFGVLHKSQNAILKVSANVEVRYLTAVCMLFLFYFMIQR